MKVEANWGIAWMSLRWVHGSLSFQVDINSPEAGWAQSYFIFLNEVKIVVISGWKGLAREVKS